MATTPPPATALAQWFSGPFTPQRRLVVFPHAGAGALSGRDLQAADTEVLTHRRPGRESRMAEPAVVDVSELVAEALAALLPILDADERPTVALGHSFGALLAAEFTAAMDRERPGRLERTVLSAKAAPPDRDPHLASILEDDAALAAWLLELGGTPEELLTDPGLRELVLAPLRADLRASLSYDAAPPDLATPLLLVHAQEDRTASAESMAGWTSTGGTATLTIPGGHHGLFDHARELHDALRSAVDGTTGGAR